MSADSWIHFYAGLTSEMDSITSTTILGQVPDTQAWIVRVDGLSTDWGEYWYPTCEYLAVSRMGDEPVSIDTATKEQLALFPFEVVKSEEND